MPDYQRPLVREIETRLETKCDMLAEIFASEEIGEFNFYISWSTTLCLAYIILKVGTSLLNDAFFVIFCK